MNLLSSKRKALVRGLVWVGGACLLFLALSWVLVPRVLRHEIETQGSAAMGRQVSVGEIDFKPWSLELTLRDLAVATLDGDGAQFSLERLYIDMAWQSLWRLAPVVDAVSLEQPVLQLTHTKPGHYDVDDLIERFSTPDDKPSKPLAFALHNLSLQGGALSFHDTVAGHDHHVSDLQLDLPFLSNFASGREVSVAPRLAFKFNGSRFEADGQTAPFSDSRQTQLNLRLEALDVQPYVRYLPSSLPVRLQAGQLDADLKLSFRQQPELSLSLSGQLDAKGVRVAQAQGQPWLSFPSLKVALKDLQPLQRRVHLGAVVWQGVELALSRDAQGRLQALGANGTPAPTGPSKPAAAPAAQPWAVVVDDFQLAQARVAWQDDSTQPVARAQLSDLNLSVQDLQWPMRRAAQFKGQFLLAPEAPAARATAMAPARLRFFGSGTDQAASVSLLVNDLPLSLGQPYAAAWLRPTLAGKIQLVGGLGWRAPDLALNLSELAVDDLRLQQDEQSLLSWERLALQSLRLDLSRQTLEVGALNLSKPRTTVSRDGQGRWMAEAWLRPSVPMATPTVAASDPAPRPSVAQASPPRSSWQFKLDKLAVSGGSVGWRDLPTPGRPVQLDLSALTLQAGPWSHGQGTWGASPVALQLNTVVSGRRAPEAEASGPGRLDYRGTLDLTTLSTQGNLEASRLPIQALEPYFAEALNIELLRADASFRGGLSYTTANAGPTLQLKGDVALEDVRANSVLAHNTAEQGPPTSEELLSWKALNIRGLSLAMVPAAPLALVVAETSLTDLYARVVVNPDGRLNLQHLLRSATPAGSQAPPPQRAAEPAPATASAVAPRQAPPTAPVIRLGPLAVVNARVLFSDHFIQPNYSANLTELTGRMGGFSSVPGAEGLPLADLELRGRAEGSAALEVTGRLNPLAKPLVLDIQGKMRDLDLPPLSPYAVKYAGYGIERGKLSATVAYHVQPNGQLTASNKLVLNQLTFGDPVAGAPNSLPVKLAVALLADSQGVIDLDLPVSGSLNDPDFKVGPIVGRLVLNLVGKALTSPFSLLAGVLSSSSSETSEVVFEAGSSALTADNRAALDKLSQALIQRPSLNLTVVGHAQRLGEREGYRQLQLRQLLLAEKRRALMQAGQAVPEPLSLEEAEVPRWLQAAYLQAKITKPRNLLGLPKELTPDEMKALLLASIPVDDDLPQELAAQRGVVVRDYLLAQQVPSDQLFLGAVKTEDQGGVLKAAAQLRLSVR
ncbi:DUF748 domain-containing protein [Curvibacter sp. RS43]|uniref:DUF748 domain-containing protein n=1 Tax=Curvibacter microcysteis TaxID=3026419 RepID=UPI002362EDE5|nr:DUF748 domain-containing protein [Curvibacter sp. RS43]MDD0809169.1 DUF748 domain-containing protein [Curvibacter sp. RS43]